VGFGIALVLTGAFVLRMPFFFIPFFLFVAIAMTWIASKYPT
jgi:hypothetical protein